MILSRSCAMPTPLYPILTDSSFFDWAETPDGRADKRKITATNLTQNIKSCPFVHYVVAKDKLSLSNLVAPPGPVAIQIERATASGFDAGE
jgi:hypothetical protein